MGDESRAEHPRRRDLIGPMRPSNRPINPSRSTNSLTAAMPDTGVRLGSGAPIRTRRATRRTRRTLCTRWVSFHLDPMTLRNRIVPGQTGPVAIPHRSPATIREVGPQARLPALPPAVSREPPPEPGVLITGHRALHVSSR
jgi:hypothetical protein